MTYTQCVSSVIQFHLITHRLIIYNLVRTRPNLWPTFECFFFFFFSVSCICVLRGEMGRGEICFDILIGIIRITTAHFIFLWKETFIIKTYARARLNFLSSFSKNKVFLRSSLSFFFFFFSFRS